MAVGAKAGDQRAAFCKMCREVRPITAKDEDAKPDSFEEAPHFFAEDAAGFGLVELLEDLRWIGIRDADGPVGAPVATDHGHDRGAAAVLLLRDERDVEPYSVGTGNYRQRQRNDDAE